MSGQTCEVKTGSHVCLLARCDAAVEARSNAYGAVRWFITMGHPGFNNPSNNGNGYESASRARSMSARCNKREERSASIKRYDAL